MYRIGTVCERTGIRPETLRAWERRYSIVEPQRSPAGYRLYSEEHIARLKRVKRLIDGGLAAGEAAAQVLREGSARAEETGSDPGHRPLRGARARLLAALLALDEVAADRALRLDAPVPFEARILGLLLPVLRELRWLDGRDEAGPGRRAFGERRLGGELAAIVAAVGAATGDGPLDLVVTPSTCADEAGATAASALLTLRGRRVLHLGRLALPEISRVAIEKRPDRLILVLGAGGTPRAMLPLLATAAAQGTRVRWVFGAVPSADRSGGSGLESLIEPETR